MLLAMKDLYIVPLVLGGGVLLLLLALRLGFKGQRFLVMGQVTGIVGRKGHGKSLFLVHEMLRTVGRLQRCEKCTRERGEKVSHRVRVASNNFVTLPPKLQEFFIPLDPSLSDEDWWAQMELLPHCCLVVIDEMGIRAPASQGFRLCGRATAYLAECRKFQHEVIWCAQREDRVTVGVRAQTAVMGLCSRGYFRSMSVRFCEPEDIDRLRRRSQTKFKALSVYRYRVTKRLGAAYDTFALIRAVHDETPLPRLHAVGDDG